MRRLTWRSWHLWKAFTHNEQLRLPILLTLSRYMSASAASSRWLRWAEGIPVVLLVVIGVYTNQYHWRYQPEGVLLIVLLPGLLSLILFYAAFIPEFDLVLQMNAQMHHDQFKGHFDLLSVQPYGITGFYWTLILYRYRFRQRNRRARRVMRRLASGFRWLTTCGLLPAVLVVLLRETPMYLIDTQSVRQFQSIIFINSFNYLVLILILALLCFTAFTWYLQSSVSSVLLCAAATTLSRLQRRFSRWVMILSFVVYQLVFSLLPIVLLTLLIADQAYRLAVTYDPAGHIRLMNTVALLLLGSVVVREISIVVLWRFVRTQVDDEVVLPR